MLTEAHQLERRGAIVRILRDAPVRRQADLVRLLKQAGHDATQSSISRDLRDLGVLKASGRYVLPPDEQRRANGAGTISGDDTIFIATASARAQQQLIARLHELFRV